VFDVVVDVVEVERQHLFAEEFGGSRSIKRRRGAPGQRGGYQLRTCRLLVAQLPGNGVVIGAHAASRPGIDETHREKHELG
jgi:hypothetical protein